MRTKHILYNGEVELDFDSMFHVYRHNGIKVPNATTVLATIAKPQLIPWAANVAIESVASQWDAGVSYDEVQIAAILESSRLAHKNRKTNAGSLGTFIHGFLEKWVKKEIERHGLKPYFELTEKEKILNDYPSLPVNETLKNAILEFFAWVKKNEVEFLTPEQKVYSRKFGYTGTLDVICKIKSLSKNLFLTDYKTSSGIYTEAWLQTAAYRYARTEEFPEEEYDGQLVIRIDKETGKIQTALCRNYETYWNQLTGFIAALKLYKTLEALKGYKGEVI